jgi:hypothetical protein
MQNYKKLILICRLTSLLFLLLIGVSYAQSGQNPYELQFKVLKPAKEKTQGLLLGFSSNAGYKTLWFTFENDKLTLNQTFDYIAAPQQTTFRFIGSIIESKKIGEKFNIGREFVWDAEEKSQISAAIQKMKSEARLDFEKEIEFNLHYFDRSGNYIGRENYSSWTLEAIKYVGSGFYQKDHYYELLTEGRASRTVETSFIPLHETQQFFNRAELYISKNLLKVASDTLLKRNRLGKIKIDNFNEKIPDSYFLPESMKVKLYRKKGVVRCEVEPMIDYVYLGQYYFDVGLAPKSLIAYNEMPLDYDHLKKMHPNLKDVIVSPLQDIVIFFIEDQLIGYEIRGLKEVLRYTLPASWSGKSARLYDNLNNPCFVMVEWCTSPEQLEFWERELKK